MTTAFRPRPTSVRAAALLVAALLAAGVAVAAPAAADGGPVPQNDTYGTGYGDTLTVPASSGILVNDDKGPWAGIAVTQVDLTGLQGTASVGDDGSFTFTPAAGFTGLTSFGYRISDGAGHFSPSAARVTIGVAEISGRPDSYTLGYKVPTLHVDASGVLANDKSIWSITGLFLDTGPSHGTLDIGGSGAFNYTPTPGFAGTDSFLYRATDLGGNTSTPTRVTITVDAANADLGVRVFAAGPQTPGSTFAMSVTVTGAGPAVAPYVTVGLDLGPLLTVTAAPGGAIATGGHSVGWSLPRVRIGSRAVLKLTVAVPAGATGRSTVTAAVRSLTVPDRNPANDRVQIAIRPTPAA